MIKKDLLIVLIPLLILIPFINSFVTNVTEQEIIVTKIYSCDVAAVADGRFILGTGILYQSPQYYFFKEKDGGYILDRLPAALTVIKECEDVAPHMEQTVTRSYRTANWLDRMFGHTKGEKILVTEVSDNLRTLVVPLNTIKMEFNINI